MALPMLAALISFPILIHAIGDGRFGFLTIAWMLVGYFGLFDLGLGRALTQGVAKRLAHDSAADISDLVWTGLCVLGVLGSLAGLIIALFDHWLVYSFIKVQSELRPEAAQALAILSIAVPFAILSAGLRGILEAKQAFRSINLLMMPLGVLLYVGPIIVTRFSVALPWVALSLLLVRFATCVALFVLCLRTFPGFLRIRVTVASLRDLLSFGGWMTVSNIVSPIMVNMDRVFVGARMSVSAVTYYVSPFEVITKLLILSNSVASASFPEFARLTKLVDREATRRYFIRTLTIVLVVLVPPALLAGLLAHDILRVWISTALADRSAGIMRLLALGVIINGATVIPFAYVQGLGRSDITAKFHLLELAAYVPTLLLMIGWLGLPGVALAWVLRVTMDAVLLFGYASRQLRSPSHA